MLLRDLSNRLDRYIAVENTKRATPLTLTDKQKAALLLQGINRVLTDMPDWVTKTYTIPPFTNALSVVLPNDLGKVIRITDGTTDYGFSYNNGNDVYSTANSSGWTIVYEDGKYRLKFPTEQSFSDLKVYYTPTTDELENLITQSITSPLSIQFEMPPSFSEPVVLAALASIYRDGALEAQYRGAINRLILQKPKPDILPPQTKSWRF